MRLRLDTIALSGLDSLDTGLRALALVPSSGSGAGMLYAVTGPGGGISAFRIGANGVPQLADTTLFAPDFTAIPATRLAVSDGGTTLVLGATSGGVILRSLNADGGFGSIPPGPATSGAARVLALGIGPDGTARLALSGETTALLSWPDGEQLLQTDAAADMRFDRDGNLLLATHGGALLRYDTGGTPGRLGPEEGLAVSAPTALATVTAHGAEFAILAAAGSSSLSVIGLGATGMVLRDHVLDTRTTRFADAQDVAVVERGGQVFVIAGGSDDGLSLLTLLPDGRLVHLDALENGPGGGLGGVTRLAAGVIGDTARVFALSDGSAGVAALSLPDAGSGDSLRGAGSLTGGAGADLLVAEDGDAVLAGHGGDDILVAGPGDTRMTGGTGADIFVMTEGGGGVTITDFSIGEDRLDLSDYMMLRAPAQLEVTPTADGARIRYRAEEIHLHSDDGASLDRDDLFGSAFDWPDRMPILTPDPPVATPPPDDGGGNGTGSGSGNSGFAPHGGWSIVTTPDTGHALIAGATVRFAPDTGAPLQMQADAAGRFDLSAVAGQSGSLTLARAHDPGGDPDIGVMDALEVLRMAVGMDPTFGPASPADLIAADIGGNGRVDVLDALTVLNVALGFEVATPPRWRFLDAQADLSGLRADNTTVPEGVVLDIPDSGLPAIDLTAVLTGHIAGW